MGIELSRNKKIIIYLVIAASFGAIFGIVFHYSSSYGAELSIVRDDLVILKGEVVNAQSLNDGTTASYEFPPPLYIFEWIEFRVDVHNISEGVLEINFTRDGRVLQTFFVYDSAYIVLGDYGEYRLQKSNVDVTLRALDGDIAIGTIYILVNRGTREYNPLISALSYEIFVAIAAVLWIRSRRKDEGETFHERSDFQQIRHTC
ncbi:MAG: hypothetical protein QXZ25_05530 [Candidatus Bathyarchaeia archaeon]